MRASRDMRSIVAAALAGALVLGGPSAARAFHTVFDFQVDRFEIDGSQFGPADGVADRVDEFDDGSLAPDWFVPTSPFGFLGTAFESGGFLHLTNPGAHYPGPGGIALDVTIVGSGTIQPGDGEGDFTTTSVWQPSIPDVGHHFHFSLYTYGGVGGFYSEIFGLAMLRTDAGLQVEQHLTEIDQYQGVYQNTLFEFVDVTDADVTGQIVFRLHFDDATNTATSSFSLDGGTTWQAPFQPAPIFVGRTRAQILLSADPQSAASPPTTTTTSTTLPPGACSVAGCRRAVERFKGRLVVNDRPGGDNDTFSWKWRKGEPTYPDDFGAPFSETFYDFCIGNGLGESLVTATLLPGPSSWKTIGTQGFRYVDPGAGAGGIRSIVMRATEGGQGSVTVKGRGTQLALPPLPWTLPLTVRLGTSTGTCWAETFTAAGVIRHTDTQFSGKAGE